MIQYGQVTEILLWPSERIAPRSASHRPYAVSLKSHRHRHPCCCGSPCGEVELGNTEFCFAHLTHAVLVYELARGCLKIPFVKLHHKPCRIIDMIKLSRPCRKKPSSERHRSNKLIVACMMLHMRLTRLTPSNIFSHHT